MDAILLKRLFDALVLPPGGPVLLLLVALLLRRALPLVSLAFALLGGGAIALLSIPVFASALAGPLERVHPPLLPEAQTALTRLPAARRPQAIVVLGGGARRAAHDEPGRQGVNELTLSRIVAGARVQRLTGLPIAVTGGSPDAGETSEAELMARVIESVGGAVRWTETSALDTADNGRHMATLLHPAGVRRLLLVTHAYHMPRSVAVFEAAGFEIVPLPIGHFAARMDTWQAWMPSANALRVSWLALHEHVGLLWYRWRGHLRPVGGAPAALVSPAG